MKTLILPVLAVLFISSPLQSQVGMLPKGATNTGQLPSIKSRPVIKKETRYVAVTPVYTVTSTITTAEQAYWSRGVFLLRTARDYRYITQENDLGHSGLLWYFFNDPRQFWTFIIQPGNKYKIKNLAGECLQWGGSGSFYIVTKPDAPNDKQLWELEEADHGNYYLKASNGKYLGVFMDQVKDKTPVSLRDKEPGTSNQKWHLIKWTEDGRRSTSFVPEANGFRFTNGFIGEDGIRWGGLCGGMVYTALDYFRSRIALPRQSYMPANRTPLQSYIYERQNHAIWDVNSSWSDLEVSYNTRGGELFRWGIEGTGSGRFKEVMDAVNANQSKPLGLFAGGVRGIDNADGGRHVVLIVGYAQGRYTGDPNQRSEEIKILIYNPNQGNILTTLVPDRARQCYFEVESGNAWRTYFVNNRYDGSHTPPRDIPNFPEGEPEGSVRHLYATFVTGNDDLRGENDNVSITVQYSNGDAKVFNNVNNGARWVDETSQTVHLALNRAVSKADISGFLIRTSFGTDIFSDDWNLKNFYVSSGMGGTWYAWADPPSGSPYIHRFSGDQRTTQFTVRRAD